ncbi:MAG: efflux RND transporter periplasmic adaptor subunit [Chloroflexota bacterium]|nr:efflux RND transporter periplasmic adaptor subunit [Chloroflexota bacterium]
MNKLGEIIRKRKKIIIIIVASIIIIGGFFAFRFITKREQAAQQDSLQTVTLERGSLVSLAGANGTVRSQQSVTLVWQLSGEVEDVLVDIGERVTAGNTLASLSETSLPSHTITAQAELVSAQQDLDDLLYSQTQQAQALKDIETTEQALEDALHPELAQAQAQAAIAEANQTVEKADRWLEILTTPPSDWSIQQAYSNILLEEDQLDDFNEQIEKTRRQIPKATSFAIRADIMGRLKKMEYQLVQLQVAYERSIDKYNHLLAPPDALDLLMAEADVASAQAQLIEAKHEWELIKDDPSAAKIAVLEAKLADARREWQRVKDGPAPDDIAAAEARVDAVQATLNQVCITAPFDGVITQAISQPGDQVEVGTVAFRLDDLSRLTVDIQISEMDINRIEIGQDVTLRFDAVLAKEYHGRVVDISPVGTETEGTVDFGATIELIDADAEVRPGMTSEVDVIVGHVDDDLLVPNQAIRMLSGQRVVYALGDNLSVGETESSPEEGINLSLWMRIQQFLGISSAPTGIHPVTITIGMSSDSYSQVINGALEAGVEIILDPPDEIVRTSQR